MSNPIDTLIAGICAHMTPDYQRQTPATPRQALPTAQDGSRAVRVASEGRTGHPSEFLRPWERERVAANDFPPRQ